MNDLLRKSVELISRLGFSCVVRSTDNLYEVFRFDRNDLNCLKTLLKFEIQVWLSDLIMLDEYENMNRN